MNKGELVDKIAAETGGSNAEAARYLDAFLSSIEEAGSKTRRTEHRMRSVE